MLTIFYQHANCHANATYPFWKLYLGKENNFDKSNTKQECIPVGCVPSATVAVSGGVCYLGVRGGLLQGERRGVCSQGVCSALGGGVCSQRGLLLGGVCFRGCAWSWGGVCSWGCLLRGGKPSRCVFLLLRVVLRGGCAWSYRYGGVCLVPGLGVVVVVSQHALRQMTKYQRPPCGQTDTCKNITFATSLRTVTIGYIMNSNKYRNFISISVLNVFNVTKQLCCSKGKGQW